MLSILDSILKRLPSDGSKTAVGAVIMIASELVLPGQTLIRQAGELWATIGIIHKLIKQFRK